MGAVASSQRRPTMLLRTNRMPSFWTLQLLGWGSYGFLWYLASLPLYEDIDAVPWLAAIRVLYYVGIGCAITLLLRPLYHRLWARDAAGSTLLLAAVVGSLLGTLIWLILFEGVKWPLDAPAFQNASVWKFARPAVSNSFVLLAWSALYFGLNYQHDLREQEQRTLRAETLAREAQLQMLRYQINPHFLFNTLNTLRTLIGEDDRRAKQIVTELSDFLRYSLLDLNARTVPLREEVEITRAYLSIEKIRFGDRLQVDYDVDPDAASIHVPPFLVHSLVENAVKHGMATSSRPLQIRLSAACKERTLHIEVANTGRFQPVHFSANHASESNGIGLTNIRQRLQQLYPERHRFTLRAEDGWVRAVIEIDRTHEPSPASS